jgi:hypothetical protein
MSGMSVLAIAIAAIGLARGRRNGRRGVTGREATPRSTASS